MGPQTMSHELPAEFKEGVTKEINDLVFARIEGKKWDELGDHGQLCSDLTNEVRALMDSKEELKGYGQFVKATVVGVNGFNQCQSLYWTPNGMDFSTNVKNGLENTPGHYDSVMVIMTAFASKLT